jgi:hypothetical protein
MDSGKISYDAYSSSAKKGEEKTLTFSKKSVKVSHPFRRKYV